MYAFTKLGVNLPGMMVKSLMGESLTDMKKIVTGNTTFANERMCLGDWYLNYMSTKEYHNVTKSVQISFIKDDEDPIPYKVYKRKFRVLQIKRIVKKLS